MNENPASQETLYTIDAPKTYVEYRYRYIIAILFIISMMINCIMWITCAPIITNLKSIYGISEFEVTLAAMIYLICYIPINFPANYILDQYGLKKGILLGNLLTLLGSLCRVFCGINFYFVLLGQLLAAIANPFLQNSPAKISAVWFKPENRTVCTSILSVSNAIGVGIGCLIPPFFVSNSDIQFGSTYPIVKLMYIEAILAAICLIPSFFLFKASPPTPPSFSAFVHKYNFKQSMIIILNDVNFLYLCIAVGFGFAVVSSFIAVIQPFIFPFGFTQQDSSQISAIFNISGILGSVIMGLIVKKTKKYKMVLLICSIMGLASIIIFISLLFFQNFWFIAIGIMIFGFFLIPILPIGLELGCELTFPVGEAVSSGTLISWSQAIGILQILIFDVFTTTISKFSTCLSAIILVISLLILIIAVTMIKENLKRNTQDNKYSILVKNPNQKNK